MMEKSVIARFLAFGCCLLAVVKIGSAKDWHQFTRWPLRAQFPSMPMNEHSASEGGEKMNPLASRLY
jgi:hypothetical protein